MSMRRRDGLVSSAQISSDAGGATQVLEQVAQGEA
jgi:hypothetical protein